MYKPHPTIIQSRHAGATADVLVAAFRDSPLIAYMFPDQKRRDESLRWYFRASVRYAHICGECHATTSHDGVALWLPPVPPALDVWGLIRSGMVFAPYVLGRRSYRRMLQVGGLVRQYRNDHAPFSHWYLSELAVLPSRQGRGVGTALVELMLSRLDSEGCPCYVETFNEDAVEFYRRLGFHVAGEYVMPFKALTCYCMIRHGRESGTGTRP